MRVDEYLLLADHLIAGYFSKQIDEAKRGRVSTPEDNSVDILIAKIGKEADEYMKCSYAIKAKFTPKREAFGPEPPIEKEYAEVVEDAISDSLRAAKASEGQAEGEQAEAMDGSI